MSAATMWVVWSPCDPPEVYGVYSSEHAAWNRVRELVEPEFMDPEQVPSDDTDLEVAVEQLDYLYLVDEIPVDAYESDLS